MNSVRDRLQYGTMPSRDWTMDKKWLCTHARRLGLGLGLICMSACAPQVSQENFTQMERALAQMRHKMQRQSSRIEDLSDQLLVAQAGTAKNQTQRLHHDGLPRSLPVVRLSPENKVGAMSQEASPDMHASAAQSEPPVLLAMGSNGRVQIMRPEDKAASSKSATSSSKRHIEGKNRSQTQSLSLSKETPLDAQALFRRALDTFQQGATDEARRQFASFLVAHPRHSKAAQAQFWLGEALFELGRYTQALQVFEPLQGRKDAADRASQIAFRIAVAHERLGRQGRAREAFESLVARFPKSTTSELARVHLEGMGP